MPLLRFSAEDPEAALALRGVLTVGLGLFRGLPSDMEREPISFRTLGVPKISKSP